MLYIFIMLGGVLHKKHIKIYICSAFQLRKGALVNKTTTS